MRWSFWPVSITVHVIIGIAVLIVPLVAEVQPPRPAPLHSFVVATKTVPIPPEVIVPAPSVRSSPVLAPVVAPSNLEPERPAPSGPVGPIPPDLPRGSGAIDPSLFGSTSGTNSLVPPPPAPEPKPAQT